MFIPSREERSTGSEDNGRWGDPQRFSADDRQREKKTRGLFKGGRDSLTPF